MLVGGIGELLAPLSLGSGVGVLGLTGIRLPTSEAYGLLKRPLQAGLSPKGLYKLDKSILKALECSDWRAVHALQK